MNNVEEQKKKLHQKQNRLNAEAIKLKLKERKARTKNLIENGGLIVKAELDHLPSNALYGALLFIKDELQNNPELMDCWLARGNKAFNEEIKQTLAVILKFKHEPQKKIKDTIRCSYGLRFNRFRQEWYGNLTDIHINKLKNDIADIEHNIEIIDNLN